MKKNIYFTAIIYILSFSSNAQNWQWANQVGSNILQSYDYGRVITDGNNSYLIGWYSGSIYLQTDTLNSNGNDDLFIIKYDANGNELWAKGFGGDGNISQTFESAYAVFDSVNNCIYLSGSFYGTMILDAVDTLHAYNGFSNIYLAKMDLNGNFIWGKSFSNNLVDDYSYIYQYPNGNILLAGEIGDTTNFDTFQVTPGGFLARFDANGNCLWATHEYSSLNNSAPSISFVDNDILMAGGFINTLIIDTATLNSTGGSSDAFITRMDSVGKIIWIKTFGFSGSDAISAIKVDFNKDIIISGAFEDSISFDGTFVYNNNGKDLLFAKFDGNCNLIWTRNTNAIITSGAPLSISLANDGSFYSVGLFAGTVTFGSYNISTSNTSDMFLTRYDGNGDCLGVRHFGYATGNSVVTDNSGNPICAGSFQNTITIGSNTFTSNGYFDIYLAKSDVFTGIGGEGRMSNNQLIIYANPNAGKCNITVPDDFLHEKNLTLSIYDNTGKLIQQKSLEMNEGKIKLDLQAEAKGTYNVTLSNKQKSYSGKIIFQ